MRLQIKGAKKTALCALLTAACFCLSFLETLLPSGLIPLPGVKPGLCNIVIMFCLYYLDTKSAFSVFLGKTLLNLFLFTNPAAFIFSFSGGILSFSVMKIMLWGGGKLFSVFGISVSGAFFHNVGQLFAAGLMMKSFDTMAYLPVLTVSALITGIFTALAAYFLFPRILKLKYLKRT